jgi:hypothetical protein
MRIPDALIPDNLKFTAVESKENNPFCAVRFEVPTATNIKIIDFHDWPKDTNVLEEPAAPICRIEISAIRENKGNRSVRRPIKDGCP